MPVNLAQGTSVMYGYIIGFANAPLTALQVRWGGAALRYNYGNWISQNKAVPTF